MMGWFRLRLIVLIFSLTVFISSVVAQNTSAEKRLVSDLQGASWIGDSREQPAADSLLYGDDPAPIFRKEFAVKGPVRSATLYITAAGYYSASVNGKLLDKNYLDPAWTDYRKRIYYSEYDISGVLLKESNCISVSLGNGFYNPLPLAFWGNLNLRDVLPVGRPVFTARVKLVYKNGQTEEVVTDHSWKYAYGPVRRNNIYFGEVYDARRELKRAGMPGFRDGRWQAAVVKQGPGGRLQPTFFPHIQAIGIKKPLKIHMSAKDVYVADMGENFAGTFSIRLHGSIGDTVRFRMGERIYGDGSLNPMTAVAGQIKRAGLGGPGAPALAAQQGMYIFGKDTVVEYSPLFSFAVYRYMEISGLRKAPDTGDIKGIALSSNVQGDNSFTTSSELVNSIQKMIVRTFLSNMMSVQSDCPGRERFAYGGDLHATDEAFICNFDMRAFYRKVLYDWVDAVQDSIFIDAAPYVGLKYCGLNFEAAIFDLQQHLYEYYGDTAIIRELYDFDLKWMDKAARLHPSGIVDKGLSDHESLVNVPVQLLGSVAYLKVAEIMKHFSVMMHDKSNEKRFAGLEEQIKTRLKDMYWNGNTSEEVIEKQSREASMVYINSLPEGERQSAAAALLKAGNVYNKQTFYALLLYGGVIPENDRPVALDSLLKAIKEAPAGHFTTGIFGTKYILEVLSQYGYADRVFDIVNSTEYPGWGFMIRNGATTQWETWKESDNVYSNCHPMFGSVSAWFYRWLAGIRPLAPGFRKFIINPLLPEHLSSLKCAYRCPQGTITVDWNKTDRGYVFRVEVPKESMATFRLPANSGKVSVTSIKGNTSYAPAFAYDTYLFDLVAGEYLITYE